MIKEITTPTTALDVSIKQYAHWSKVMQKYPTESDKNSNEFRVELIAALCSVPVDEVWTWNYKHMKKTYVQLLVVSSDLSKLQESVSKNFNGSTFKCQGEEFTLPASMDDISAGQYEYIEKLLKQSESIFDILNYVVAILTMWDHRNLARHTKEMDRRAMLFWNHLSIAETFETAFFLASGNKICNRYTLFCGIWQMIHQKPKGQ